MCLRQEAQLIDGVRRWLEARRKNGRTYLLTYSQNIQQPEENTRENQPDDKPAWVNKNVHKNTQKT